jgi:hypothetical protein
MERRVAPWSKCYSFWGLHKDAMVMYTLYYGRTGKDFYPVSEGMGMKKVIEFAIKYPDLENNDCYIEESKGKMKLFATASQADYHAKHECRWLHPYVIVPVVDGRVYEGELC